MHVIIYRCSYVGQGQACTHAYHVTNYCYHCRYVAWNMHEPMPGQFDFTGILDIKKYIETAKRLGLNVIIRPGPYICAEWDNGGLPQLAYTIIIINTIHWLMSLD